MTAFAIAFALYALVTALHRHEYLVAFTSILAILIATTALVLESLT